MISISAKTGFREIQQGPYAHFIISHKIKTAHTLVGSGQGKSRDMTCWGKCQKMSYGVGPTIFHNKVQWDLIAALRKRDVFHAMTSELNEQSSVQREWLWATPWIKREWSPETRPSYLICPSSLCSCMNTWSPRWISPDHLLLEKRVSHCDKKLWEA